MKENIQASLFYRFCKVIINKDKTNKHLDKQINLLKKKRSN